MNVEIFAEDTGYFKKFDILGNLPKEISYKIFSYLTPKDIVNSFRCCKKWQQDINYNFIWKQIYKSVYSDNEEEPKTEVYQKFVQSYSVHWHGRFMYSALKYNIKNNKYKKIQIPLKRRYGVHFYHMDERIIILASEFIFYIINSSTGLIERRFMLRNFRKAIKHGDYLIAVKKDSSLKVWNIEDGTVFIDRRLMENAESDFILKDLLACQHLIIFVKKKRMGRMRRRKRKEVYTLDMRTGDFRHIGPAVYACCNNDLIAILEDNGNIVIKDTDLNGVTSFSGSKPDKIFNVRMNEDFLVEDYIDLDSSHFISIFNIKTKANFNITVVNVQYYKYRTDFQISKNRLVCQTNPVTVKIWDMYTQDCLFEININGCHVVALKLHDSYIYIKTIIGNVWKIWCLQTGKFVRNSNLDPIRSNIIAITNSKLLHKWGDGEADFWIIYDFAANLLEQNK